MRGLFSNWDVKDTRNIVFALLIGILLVYARQVVSATSGFVAGSSEIVTNSFVNYLYFTASADVSYIVIFQLFMLIALLPVSIIINVLILSISSSRKLIHRLSGQQFSDVDQRYRRVRRLLLLSVVPVIVGTGIIVTSVYVPLYASVNFHRNLDFLAPALSSDQRIQIISRWASMSSQADYDSINRLLKSLAQSHGLKLPTPIK